MKTTKFLSAALFVFAAISCNTENFLEPTESALEPMYISGTATKTVFTPTHAGGSVNWTAGDQLAIFDNLGGKNIFNNSDAAVASFSGEVSVGTTKFWGVYPADNVVSKNTADGTVIVDLPSDQTAAAGTFAEDLNISVTTGYKTPGVASVDNITFHNVCGLISFKLPERIAAKKVTFKASNRAIAGKLSVDCEDGNVTIVENASESVSMSGDFAKGSTFYFVVTPGDITGFRIDVETNAGSKYSLGTAEGVLNVVAGGYINLPNIDLKDGEVSVSASHRYSNDGVLTGSSLTVNHGIPSQLWKDVTNLTLSVTKDGKEYRSYNSTVNSATVTPTGSVYLPQGEYEITGSYTMNGVTKYISETAELRAPEFSVTSAGTTSYSLYKSGNSSAANEQDAHKISNISATCTISDNVLAELSANYSVSLGGSVIKSGSTNASKVTADEQTKSQGKYDLSASFTFDGVTENSEVVPCHITGLPYETSMNKNTTGWSNYSNVERDNGYFIFNPNDAYVLSPAFTIPDDINTTVTLAVYAYHTSAFRSYEPTVYVKGSDKPVKEGDSKTFKGSISLVGVEGCSKKDFSTILTNTATSISIYVSGEKKGADIPEFFINYCKIAYR